MDKKNSILDIHDAKEAADKEVIEKKIPVSAPAVSYIDAKTQAENNEKNKKAGGDN